MSTRKKFSTNIEIGKTELEEKINMRLDEFKYGIVRSFDMKLSDPTSNKPCYSYDQLSADIIKWKLLKSPEKYSYESQYTKHLS